VNFEGETQEDMAKWFDTENYAKMLTENCRSRLRAVVKHYNLQELAAKTAEIIREALLGESENDGIRFSNGMRICDVEVLGLSLGENVQELLNTAAMDTLEGLISISAAEEESKRIERMEELKRKNLQQEAMTRKSQSDASLQGLKDELVIDIQKADAALQAVANEMKVNETRREDEKATADQQAEIRAEIAKQEIEKMRSMTEMQIERIKAVEGNMILALQEFGDKYFISDLLSSLGPVAAATGVTTADLFSQIFSGTPFEDTMNALAQRPLADKLSGQKARTHNA